MTYNFTVEINTTLQLYSNLKEIYTKTEKHWSDTWNWMRGNQKVCNNFHLNGIPLSCPCFWDIESMLTPWKKSYDQHIQHIKKQRHYFANRGPSSQGYGFTVVMYGCESWTIKKGECRRIDAFELWCWKKDSWDSLKLQGDPTCPS